MSQQSFKLRGQREEIRRRGVSGPQALFRLTPGTARDGAGDTVEVSGDTVVRIELDNGFVLWSRMDDLSRDFGTPPARDGDGSWDISRLAPRRVAASERGLAGLAVRILDFFGIDLAEKSAAALGEHFEEKLIGKHPPGFYRLDLAGEFSLKAVADDEAIPGDSIEFLSTLSIVDANNQVQEFSIGGAQLPVVNTPRIIYSSGSLADFFNSVGMSTNRYLYLCAYSSASYGEEDLIKGIDLNTDVSGSAVISQRYSLDLEQLSIGNISNDDLYQIANDAIGNQGKTFNSTEMNRLPVYVYLEGLGITSGYNVSYDVKQIPFIVSGELDESVEYVIKYDVPGHMGDAVACFKLHDTYLFNDINITLGELPAEGDLPQYEE